MPNSRPVICAILLFFTTLAATAPILACERHLERADHYHKLRRAGGSASQMARWQEQRKKYQQRYQDCRLGDRSGGSILTASGRTRAPEKPDYQKVRKTAVSDVRVRKLLKTCNYWVKAYNRRPSDDRRSYRDSACRAFSDARERLESPPQRLSPHRRTLEECIKPGSRLDNEVQECLEGRREPTWRASSTSARAPSPPAEAPALPTEEATR